MGIGPLFLHELCRVIIGIVAFVAGRHYRHP